MHQQNPEWAAHRIAVVAEAGAPGWVTFSQVHYHPWRAFVDGTETTIWRANSAFQAVEIPSGRHRLELVYRDDAFRFGCMMSLAGLALTCLLIRQQPWKPQINANGRRQYVDLGARNADDADSWSSRKLGD